jgi:hypothetical protein
MTTTIIIDLPESVAREVEALAAERGARADWEWFDRPMAREGGEPPCAGDRID